MTEEDLKLKKEKIDLFFNEKRVFNKSIREPYTDYFCFFNKKEELLEYDQYEYNRPLDTHSLKMWSMLADIYYENLICADWMYEHFVDYKNLTTHSEDLIIKTKLSLNLFKSLNPNYIIDNTIII